ncbi:MAG: hypothetical protein GX442_22815 [Candidatus Riflebacteria bacterium]|nr:hypothetical protein [Candidatus Riflebacteria bacterium]
MFARRLTWMIVTLSLLLLPAFSIGCGADDADSNTHNAIYTIGPGALEDFHSVASGS